MFFIEGRSLILDYTYIFYKQPIYKPLALGWQIAKQLSGLRTIETTD